MDTATRHIVFILFLLTVVTGVQSNGCPDGWHSHAGSCYVYMRESYNWFDAKVACEVLGAQMVEIQSPEENHFLGGLIRSYGGSSAWIGLEDILEEGQFVWVSSRQKPAETHWDRREPDDHHGAEDCAAMWTSGLWYDTACEASRLHCLCELPGLEGDIIG